jgi:hypothetical protein
VRVTVMRAMARMFVVIVAVVAWPAPAISQYGVWHADSLLASGALHAAESAYYAASSARPRDPAARAALGRFLAARGAPKVGAVLLEEARRFGGDSARLATALVPMYERAGDYASLVMLRPVVLSEPARRRARYLRDNPPAARIPDTVAIVTYRPSADGSGFGTVILRVGRVELPAIIDPRASGLVLPAASRGEVREFGTEGSRRIGSVRAVRLGGVTLSNVPATIGHPGEPVRIGFDVLAPYSPSFDPARGLMALRRVERRAQQPAGQRVPALFDVTGLRLLLDGAWHQSGSAHAAMLLATRPWQWDHRRGDLLLR